MALSVAAAGGSLVVGAVASPASSATPPPAVQALSADGVADSVGVCVHVGFLDTPYKDATVVRDALADLGVRHVRDQLTMNTPWQYASMRTVAQAGVKFDLITGNPTDAAPSAYVDTVASQLPGVVETLEGTNEWDISGRSHWVSEVRSRQQALYAAAKADPATADLPVLSPSIAFPWNWDAAGDFGSMADLGNGHLYPGGRNPSYQLGSSLSSLLKLVDDKPVVVSESGYHNATASLATNANGHPMVPEDVSATYLPRTILENFSHGALRTYLYELIDEFDDPARTNPEAHFGLLRHDLSHKPAYTAVKNLLRLVADPVPSRATAFSPGSLRYSVAGGDSSLRQLLVQRRDGHFVVLLWRDVSVYDTSSRTRTSVAPQSLTVHLGTPADVAVHRPNVQPAPVASYLGASDVPVALGAQVAAVDITPETGETTPVLNVPTGVRATPKDRSAIVSWRQSDATGLTGFEVVRQPGGLSTTVPANSRSVRVAGLRNGSAYTFSVRALTSSGASAAATPVRLVPGTVPSAPRLGTLSPGRARMGVAWSAALAQGRTVTAYEVVSGRHHVITSSGVRRTVLRGLPARAAVRVGVRARNAFGWGPVRWSRVVRTR